MEFKLFLLNQDIFYKSWPN